MERVWEYRIKYNAGSFESVLNSYHYYNAENAIQALQFHDLTMKRNGVSSRLISVERKCPYSNKWIDETRINMEDKQ